MGFGISLAFLPINYPIRLSTGSKYTQLFRFEVLGTMGNLRVFEVKGEIGCTVDSFQNIRVPRKYVEKVKSMHLCNLCHVLQKKNNVLLYNF